MDEHLPCREPESQVNRQVKPKDSAILLKHPNQYIFSSQSNFLCFQKNSEENGKKDTFQALKSIKMQKGPPGPKLHHYKVNNMTLKHLERTCSIGIDAELNINENISENIANFQTSIHSFKEKKLRTDSFCSDLSCLDNSEELKFQSKGKGIDDFINENYTDNDKNESGSILEDKEEGRYCDRYENIN